MQLAGLCGRAGDATCLHHPGWRGLRDLAVKVMAVAIPESPVPWPMSVFCPRYFRMRGDVCRL